MRAVDMTDRELIRATRWVLEHGGPFDRAAVSALAEQGEDATTETLLHAAKALAKAPDEALRGKDGA